MRFSGFVVLASLVVPLGACDSNGAAAGGANNAQASTESAGKESSPRRSGGAKWGVTYSGDLSGSIEGFSVIASGPVAVGKVSITSKRKENIQATFLDGDGDGDRPVTVIITLADGSECRSKSGATPTGRVTKDDPKTFAAEIAGVAHCGEDRIEFEAWFAK